MHVQGTLALSGKTHGTWLRSRSAWLQSSMRARAPATKLAEMVAHLQQGQARSHTRMVQVFPGRPRLRGPKGGHPRLKTSEVWAGHSRQWCTRSSTAVIHELLGARLEEPGQFGHTQRGGRERERETGAGGQSRREGGGCTGGAAAACALCVHSVAPGSSSGK